MPPERQPPSIRSVIVAVATLVWLLSELLSYINPKISSEPGIGAAYMAVLAAALAFPELDKRRRDKRDGSGKNKSGKDRTREEES
jgi:membrane associated rhomboid family serine protease